MTDVDVLVVGGGGGGLTAAAAAADAGATVAVLERLARVGGNTVLSAASIPGAGTAQQSRAGIEDDPGRFERDVLRVTGPVGNGDVLRALANASPSLIAWLSERVGLDLEIITAYRHVGHSVPRLHAPPGRTGAELVAALLRHCERLGVVVATGTRVTALEPNSGGYRVKAVGLDGAEDSIDAASVVLASNGFGADPDLVAAHCPDMAAALYFGADGSSGDALRWGRGLAARTQNMSAFQGHATVAVPHGVLLSWTAMELGGVLVDANGQRFVDESLGYSRCASAAVRAGGPRWAMFDAGIEDVLRRTSADYRSLEAMGGVRVAASADELASVCGFAPARAGVLLDEVAALARGEAPDPLGRTDFGGRVLERPLRAVQVAPALFHTQGGLMVDGSARVQGVGGVVRGLYAVGGAAAGISGDRGPDGYCSGNGLLAALGLGWIAGRHAVGPVGGPDETGSGTS